MYVMSAPLLAPLLALGGALHVASAATPVPAPTTNAEFAKLMARASKENATVLRYVYPSMEQLTRDVYSNWVPATEGCDIKFDCWCYHVRGDMSSAINPDGWKRCAHLAEVEAQCNEHENTCRCFSGNRCLFSDMRPTKILAVLTAARLAGIEHIIEEGRFGGLSAFMYALHGFRVTSVEFLPLDGPTTALREMAPGVRRLDGDGSVLLPQLVGNLTRAEAARTMVIFDGEKRTAAYLKTYTKIRHKVALAVFDDTNLSDGPNFKRMLAQNGHVFFDTLDREYAKFIRREAAPLTLIQHLSLPAAQAMRVQRAGVASLPTRRDIPPAPVETQQKWFGGVDKLQRFHFTIVRGDAWAGPPPAAQRNDLAFPQARTPRTAPALAAVADDTPSAQASWAAAQARLSHAALARQRARERMRARERARQGTPAAHAGVLGVHRALP
mmetsp:Transcript_12284/g.32136  ORF Transcript_12284/g.32136 Transcript_12284/m.32136 type:complete len:441 (-) Transcript_12284:353-1675(-)